ncbi:MULTISPECIES: CehA/McbA family metallohydrolase [unclassified Massilia]|uniref:CehA/McbA family metallohydrolase n=1 Tax=unclassified Massilia TaxID=2609279 RepID=UPI00178037D0|nr:MULTISPECIES: CehA/McbA family metallohydrolase [unclassified Massilia]MBD8532697.1 CehA/McbA family metallohydrolase [Massilia sp. CFBP 13647]MBD8676058.1 CehA/McbA family metallohydrolase [Massilia sp. CFBP 13721]
MKTSLHTPAKLALFLLCLCAPGAFAAIDEHSEFEATLYAPYRAPDPGKGEARTFTLAFDYPNARQAQVVDWQLELISPRGVVVRRWQDSTPLAEQPVTVTVPWSGLDAGKLAAGVYGVRLRATSRDALAKAPAPDVHEQLWQIEIGPPQAPVLPPFAPLPSGRIGQPGVAPAAGALPFIVYLGNLHSQTNHSDGGAELSDCKGAQEPLTAKYGPDAAFGYARKHGLDILVASEHNHMYDGSDGTKADTDPAVPRALYRKGLDTAAGFNAAHSDFLAVYGMEWGVINKGGHVNIFNGTQLLGWEKNAKGELLADVATPRSDYAALYTLMRERGWVGQFNHPSTSGQFSVNGTALGYTADGDEAMALCEVVNSTAFSKNDKEGETRRSNFETACNKILEAGFHVAFSTNQDNHCANWGTAYTNRTGILIPNGAALSQASFVDALKARRVFATMDKGSQLVLTANGRMMGERFTNTGPLNVVAHFASTAGKQVASVAIMEGVPGRGGVVTQMSDQATVNFTPSAGAHFYYAKVTQADGNILWSAPVWVTQEVEEK